VTNGLIFELSTAERGHIYPLIINEGETKERARQQTDGLKGLSGWIDTFRAHHGLHHTTHMFTHHLPLLAEHRRPVSLLLLERTLLTVCVWYGEVLHFVPTTSKGN